jgi:hypothetical protein
MTAPMPRLVAFLTCAFLASALALSSSPIPARAQEPSPIALTLIAQTPWNSVERPVLDVTVRAQNPGDQPVRDLSLGVTLWGPARTRTAYEESLVADPSSAIVLDARTLPRRGAIPPGGTRDLEIKLDLASVGLSTTESLIYPLKIDVRSGLTSLAALRTPVIYLVQRPETPIRLSWTFVLNEPIYFGPDGVFTTPSLEQALAPGGWLASELPALVALADDPSAPQVDVVVSPLLLNQLVRMRDGYSVIDHGTTREVPAGRGGATAAAQVITDLRRIAAGDGVELSALPFSAPSLPALAAGGLSHDLATQLQRGRDVLEAVLAATPNASILSPPGSAIDRASLDELASQGVRTLLVEPQTIPPAPQPLDFAPPAVASIAAGAGQMTAVVSDPSIGALLTSSTIGTDPALAAQAVLGELAAIWLERPSVERTLAITFPDGFRASGAFFGPLVRGVAGAPWLEKTHAALLALASPPSELSQAVPTVEAFTRAYVEELKAARRRLDIYRSMLVHPSTEPARLETMLLFAESGQYVVNEGPGLEFIHAVRDEVGALFAGISADAGQKITLTSSTGGVIPVRVTNDNDIPVHVLIRLVSSHLTAPDADRVFAAGETATVNFDVALRTAGLFRVDVQVVSPSGRAISHAQLIVRSTGFNRIAILITLGAAAMLLLVWARRFLPRPTS